MNQNGIGEFIQSVRKEKNLTQKDLADAIGVSDKTVSKWENGNSVPDTTLLKPLCNLLDISVNELLSGKRLPPEDYSENAENNMISLLKDNQSVRKNNMLQNIIGVALLLAAMILMGITMQVQIIKYLDIFSLLIPALICVGIVLISSRREKREVIYTLRKSIVPAGVVSALVQAVGILWNMNDPSKLGPNLSIAILTLLYSTIAYLVFLTIERSTE